jgi:hypothetical protein
MAEHPSLGLTSVYAAMIPTMPFKPTVHLRYAEAVLHYAEAVLPVKDGLLK